MKQATKYVRTHAHKRARARTRTHPPMRAYALSLPHAHTRRQAHVHTERAHTYARTVRTPTRARQLRRAAAVRGDVEALLELGPAAAQPDPGARTASSEARSFRDRDCVRKRGREGEREREEARKIRGGGCGARSEINSDNQLNQLG